MGRTVDGAAGRHIGARPHGLTDLILRLAKMTQEELMAANPIIAANYFKVYPNHAAGYIILEQSNRGYQRKLNWVPYPPHTKAPK